MIRLMRGAVLLLLLFSSISTSQIHRPRDKAIVVFASKVTKVTVEEYLYSYTVTNSPPSEEIFHDFSMTIVDSLLQENVTEITEPANKKWFIGGDSQGFVSGTAANRFVGVPPSDGLAPGESMTFSFSSKGLPSIKLFYARSYEAPYTSDELDSLYAIGYTDVQLFPDWKENSYKGLTIAPHVFDSPIAPLAFLDTLISYKHQARALGWILNDGIVTSLDQKLEAARQQIAKDKPAAKQILQAFVNEVEALNQQGNQITSEAYALLKFNAEYLMSKL